MGSGAWPLAFAALIVCFSTAALAHAVVTECSLALVLRPTSQDAPVTEFAAANVTFHGNVSVSKPAPFTGRVMLTLATGPHRDGTLSPASFDVGQGEQFLGQFVVNVTIPPTQQAHSGAQVVVTAKGEFQGLNCAQALAQSIAGADVWYGAMTGAALPGIVSLGQATDRATVSLHITQATNAPLPPVQALITVAQRSGFVLTAPPLANLTGETAGVVAKTFEVIIERTTAASGTYDLVVHVRSNAHGIQSNVSESSVDVVVRVVVEARIGTLQFAAAVGIGAGMLVTIGLWWWNERRG